MGLGKNVLLDPRNVWGNWYVSETDPVSVTGANVKAGDPWCRTDDDLAPTAVTGLFVRNLTNSAWISMLSSGPEGDQGPEGAPGSVWHHGAGVPDPGLGIDGDYYFDDTTGQIYYKVTGTWGLIATVQGEDGTDGTGFNWRGVWDVGTFYEAYDVVSGSDDNLYLAIADSTGDDPLSSPASWELFLPSGSGAPQTADYLVKTADATLSAERVVTDTISIIWDWATGGQAKATRAALTGDVTAAADSNTTVIKNDVALGGNPTTTTQSAGNSSTRIATTAFVMSAIAVLIGTATAAGDTLGELEALIALKANLASPAFTGTPSLPTGTTVVTQSAGDSSTKPASTAFVAAAVTKAPQVFIIPLSDETTAITTGTDKAKFRVPWACTLTAVRSSLSTTSSSGIPTVDINKNGTTVLSTKLTIDASEVTSVTAATAAVISVSSFADDDEMEFDIDVAGTGAKGLKVTVYLTPT